jgi:hypothetical protein
VRWLVRRYLEGFGPASVQDVAQFSLLRRPVVRDALWDSTLLAYADRSRVIPPAYRRLITRQNGDVLPTLLVDGYVAGSGARSRADRSHGVPRAARRGQGRPGRGGDRPGGVLADREPMVYRRYTHWWDELPDRVVRALPG